MVPVKPVEQVQVHPVLLLPETELAWLLQLELVVQGAGVGAGVGGFGVGGTGVGGINVCDSVGSRVTVAVPH